MTNSSSSCADIDDIQAAGQDQAIASRLRITISGLYVPTNLRLRCDDRRELFANDLNQLTESTTICVDQNIKLG